MSAKRSRAHLRALVERAAEDVHDLSRRGLRLIVDDVEAHGRPPRRLVVRATLHFLTAGAPFCCTEPGCHLGADLRGPEIGDHVRRAMGVEHAVAVEFQDLGALLHAAVRIGDGS